MSMISVNATGVAKHWQIDTLGKERRKRHFLRTIIYLSNWVKFQAYL